MMEGRFGFVARRLWQTVSIMVFALLVLAVASAAYAQDGDSGDNSIMGLVAAAIPGIIAMLWSWWQNRAIRTAATWDDASVTWIKSVAKAVVDGAKPPAPPPPSV